MNHADVRARMADYLEGHLELTDRALLDAHLDACPDCSADIAEMRATIGLLRGLPEPEVPGDFSANVMRRIRAGEATPGFFDRVGMLLQDAFSPRVLAPASAALLSAGFVLWGQQIGLFEPGGGGRMPAHLQEPAALAQAEAPVSRAEESFARARKAAAPEPGLQLAGLEAVPASAPPPPPSDSIAGAPGSVLHVRIALDMAPPPYQIDASSPPPVRVPFRSDRGGDWSASAPTRSLAVASRPLPARGEATVRDGVLHRSAAPPATGGYGIGTDAARSEPRSRDDWLAILEGNPAQFAEQLSQLSLAEQELWVDRLARHAAEQGSLDRVVERLRSAGGDVGRVLADDFAAVGQSVSQ